MKDIDRKASDYWRVVEGKKTAYGENWDIRRKNEKYDLKSWISSSKKKQGLNLLTMHYIVSPNKVLMN